MRVEQPPRPVGRRLRSCDEVRGGRRAVGDDRLLLGRQRCVRSLVGTTVDDDGEPALGDERLDVDLDVEVPTPTSESQKRCSSTRSKRRT